MRYQAPITWPKDPTPLVSWACYEPSGYALNFEEPDLLNHTFILGSTGSGKTTLLYSAIRQLIKNQASNKRQKTGLLILDPKVDETVAIVQSFAREVRRQKDLIVLGPNGDHFYDLFGILTSLDSVETVARKLLLCSNNMGSDNTFWSESRFSLIHAALTVLTASCYDSKFTGIPFELVSKFMSSLFFGIQNTCLSEIEAIKSQCEKWVPRMPLHHQRQVGAALDALNTWRTMDSRTKSNLQACLINSLSPMSSTNASKCFEPHGRSGFDPSAIAAEGKICIVSINALTDPGLAQLLFRMVRMDFFAAVQKRQNTSHRLCGMIADEYPLVASQEDVEQLATVRSKRCFVIGASQGISILDERLGLRNRKAILLNFNTLVFLRSREDETSLLALTSLGYKGEFVKKPRMSNISRRRQGDVEYVMLPVCPTGTLGSLEPHQAYIAGSKQKKTLSPVWFVPWYEDVRCPKIPLQRRQIANTQNMAMASYAATLMASRNIKPLYSPEVVHEAAKRFGPHKSDRVRLSMHASEYFLLNQGFIPKGLKKLPLGWIAAIPGILRDAQFPFSTPIASLEMIHGLILVSFGNSMNECQPHGPEHFDDLRVLLQLCIYPSIYRNLQTRHFVELWVEKPDLRPALLANQPEISVF